MLNRRKKVHHLTPWVTRADMVFHALKKSLPWFVMVNLSFAAMILLRGQLFEGYDNSLGDRFDLLPWIDVAMAGVFLASVGLLSLIRLPAKPASLVPGLLLFMISLLWCIAAYCFVALWHLPFGWPLVCVLLFSGLAALYFHLAYLLCFSLPLWLFLPVISYQLNQSSNPRFMLLWLIVSVILVFGRYNLYRWFTEAWSRYEENRSLIARLDLLASQDALTELANRRTLETYLLRLSSQGQSFALIMLDVDYFKRYNDHYGHQAGDACLVSVASVLRQSMRSDQDLAARYGGEEFTLVLSEVTAEEAAQVAGRIQQQLAQTALPHAASEVSETVTVSIGIAASSGAVSPEQIIATADDALYRAKRGGRNRWSF